MLPERMETIAQLDDEKLYTAGMIAQFSRELGLYSSRSDLTKFRHNLNQVRARSELMVDPVDHIPVRGQSNQPAWPGRVWKLAVRIPDKRKKSEELAEKLG